MEYLDAEELSPEGNYRLLSTGEVVEVPTENDLNRLIAWALIVAIQKARGLAFVRYVCQGDKEVQVRPAEDKRVNRKPDVLVLMPEHLAESKQAIYLDSPPPIFAAEVVSPGSESSENYLRDYVWKRRQYEDLGISEYWIIDPHREQVTVLTLVDGTYHEIVVVGDCVIQSQTFPTLQLTADALISGQIDE